MRICFKILKYIIVLLGLIFLAVVVPPLLLAWLFYDEDRRYYKKRPDTGLCGVSVAASPICHFLRDTWRVFTILEGFCIGLASDLLFTPLLMVLETLCIVFGIPTMIYLER